VKIIYIMTIDLNEITSEAVQYMPRILDIFNNIIKEALDQLDYK